MHVNNLLKPCELWYEIRLSSCRRVGLCIDFHVVYYFHVVYHLWRLKR